jgi:hypothetical protein
MRVWNPELAGYATDFVNASQPFRQHLTEIFHQCNNLGLSFMVRVRLVDETVARTRS